MTAPLLTPSRTEAQQWSRELLTELGMVEALRETGIAADMEVHPVTRMAIIAVHAAGKPDEYVMVYDPLDDDALAEIAGRVAAFFRAVDEFIDSDDPRDPVERVHAGEPIDDGPCSLWTRVLAEIVAVTGRKPDTVSFNDDGALDQMARLYVEAGGTVVASYVGTSLPWEDQRDSATDAVDWIDRFEGIDDWVKHEPTGGIEGLRRLCDRAAGRKRSG